MAGKRSDDKIKCSFCGKTQEQVRKMVAGPSGIYICDECVEICNDIVTEELEEFEYDATDFDFNLLKPIEIKNFLDDYVIGQEEPVSSHGVMVSSSRSQPPRAANTDSRLMISAAGVGGRCFCPAICRV